MFRFTETPSSGS